MHLSEEKYKILFVDKFKADKFQFDIEFKRIINEHGDSEQLRLEFYKTVFAKLIKQIKTELSESQDYRHLINTLYSLFIKALGEDNIDTTQFEEELSMFNSNKFETKSQSSYVQEYKKYNLNTNYGRRKAREQAQRNYDNGTPEYKEEMDNIKIVVWIIIIVIALIIFLAKLFMKS